MTEKVATISDEEILEMFHTPDLKEKAFSILVKKYQERLYWHVRRMVISHDDTDDLLQNIFIKVWNKLGDFRQESGIYTWLYRIATNETLTFMQNLKKKHTRSLSDHENYLERTLKAERGFDGNSIEWKLQIAIQSLPEKQRAVFNLRYYDEMPYEKMSEVLDTSVGALKASYHHAAKKIEEFFKSS